MDEKMKELVGIDASVAGRCRPCFLYHLKKAKEIGIPKEVTNEAIELALSISRSGDEHMYGFAKNILERLK